MDSIRIVSQYCERFDGSFWAEPANAISNVAFFMTAAGILWVLRYKGRRDLPVIGLSALIACVGVASFLFHTQPTPVTGALDVLSIALFILAVFFVAIMRLFALGMAGTGLVTAGFLGFCLMISRILGPTMGISAIYAGPLLSLFAIAAAIAPRNRKLAFHFAMTGLMFTLSVSFRIMDQPACSWFPIGTHFMWHVLNAVVAYMLLRLVIHAQELRPFAPSHQT